MAFILVEIKKIVPVDCKSTHFWISTITWFPELHQIRSELYWIIANLSTASITYAISGVLSAHLKYFTSKPSPDEGPRRCCAFWQREEAQMSGVYSGLSNVTVCGWPLFLAPGLYKITILLPLTHSLHWSNVITLIFVSTATWCWEPQSYNHRHFLN